MSLPIIPLLKFKVKYRDGQIAGLENEKAVSDIV